MDFDLKNESAWEYVFISTTASSAGRQVRMASDQVEEDAEAGPETSDEPGLGTGPQAEVVFDCPPVWSSPLELDRPSYILRYPPTGRRTVQYYKSKVDLFAKNTHAQSMVMRVTLYHDEEKVLVKEVHEWFENRCNLYDNFEFDN
jgi:hypothetical protein